MQSTTFWIGGSIVDFDDANKKHEVAFDNKQITWVQLLSRTFRVEADEKPFVESDDEEQPELDDEAESEADVGASLLEKFDGLKEDRDEEQAVEEAKYTTYKLGPFEFQWKST